MSFIAACYLSHLVRYRWGRRRIVERFARHFTSRLRAARIAHHIP